MQQRWEWKKKKHLPEFSREDLAHDEERNVSVTARVSHDEQEETGQRQPTQRILNFFAVDLEQVEERSESRQSHGHSESGDEEEYPASGAIHQEHGADGGQQLNDSDDDGR